MTHSLSVGLVGLGRMGLGIAERLVAGGHRVTAFDLDPEACDAARQCSLQLAGRGPW